MTSLGGPRAGQQGYLPGAGGCRHTGLEEMGCGALSFCKQCEKGVRKGLH